MTGKKQHFGDIQIGKSEASIKEAKFDTDRRIRKVPDILRLFNRRRFMWSLYPVELLTQAFFNTSRRKN